MATLGAKSSLKKLNKKAILDVDVQKACETIVTPAAPMALRLQSNLLFVYHPHCVSGPKLILGSYGVTRVYYQQCGYILTDAEQTKNDMRLMLRAMQADTLNSEGENKGR